MAEAKDRAAWNRTFAVLAQIHNANRDPKKTEPIDPMQFFPWDKARNQQAPPPTAEDRQMLRRAIGRKRSFGACGFGRRRAMLFPVPFTLT